MFREVFEWQQCDSTTANKAPKAIFPPGVLPGRSDSREKGSKEALPKLERRAFRRAFSQATQTGCFNDVTNNRAPSKINGKSRDCDKKSFLFMPFPNWIILFGAETFFNTEWKINFFYSPSAFFQVAVSVKWTANNIQPGFVAVKNVQSRVKWKTMVRIYTFLGEFLSVIAWAPHIIHGWMRPWNDFWSLFVI